MVGVPGRSKACHSCRQRRIAVSRLPVERLGFGHAIFFADLYCFGLKCGLQRPHCSQCIKSKIVCSGYQRDRIFINVGPSDGGIAGSVAGKTMKNGEPKAATQVVGSRTHLREVLEAAAIPSRPTREVIPQALYRQQLLSAYLSHFIPASEMGLAKDRSWLALLPDLTTPTKALELSVMAFCMARLGRESNDLVLVRESQGLYTRGLCEMQRALWDPQQMYSDETLGACMALAMYEVVECPAANRRAYASHQDGCAKLVQLRGAEAHKTGLGHQLFLAFRKQSVSCISCAGSRILNHWQILQALERHQSTYLATPAWLTIPWANLSKRPLDQVFDFVSLAPTIFSQGDEIDNLNPHDALHKMLDLIDQCWKCDTALAQFYHEYETQSSGPLYWPETCDQNKRLDGEDKNRFFLSAYHFQNLDVAATLMYYWASLVMLWSGLCHLYMAVAALDLNCQAIDCECIACDRQTLDGGYHLHHFNMSRLPPLGQCSEFPSMARNICQSVEYCMQECMRGLGPAVVGAPLAIVIDTLKVIPGHDREVSWAMAVIAEVTERGLRLLKF